ncbi:MAG: fibronectin type III domain-containing protein [Acidimicrobiales bacterium]
MLLALIILALASVALITAFGTDISASAEHRELSAFDTALASSVSVATSQIQADPAVFSACPNPTGSLSAYPSSGALESALGLPGYTVSIEASGSQPAVEYSDGGTFTANCTAENVGGPQLINLVVTNGSGRSQSDPVVVDDPTPAQAAAENNSTAEQIIFINEPDGATVGTDFTTQPKLQVLSGGVPVTGDLSSINLMITPGSGPAGAVLSPACSGIETGSYVTYEFCSINEVGAGYELTATLASNGGVTTTSTPFDVFSAQPSTPVITQVTPSTVTAGAINVTFTGSSVSGNPIPGQTYTIKACTNQAMTVNCTAPTTITSGSDLTGLVPGTYYYVQITAVASANYLATTSPPSGPTMATIQLAAPSAPTLNYGAVSGALSVSFSGSANAPPSGQTYTVEACSNSSMTGVCVTNSNFTSGSNLTGLTIVPGSAGGTYYVEVTANASTGYLASKPSTIASHAATSQVKVPAAVTANPSATQVGAITASYNEPTGGFAPSSFTVTACTNAAMTTGCVTQSGFPSGGQITNLTPGAVYYVTITAVSSNAAYASATTSTPGPSAVATVQLSTPSGVTVGYGTVAGSVSISFTPPSPAAPGQTYTVTVCKNVAMTTGCVSNANFTSGANYTGLAYTAGTAGATYWVQVMANGSSGYFASTPSGAIGQSDTSQVAAPGTPAAASSTTTGGAIVVTFAASTGSAPSSYSALACTNTGMTTGCVSVPNYASGAQLTGLVQGTVYYTRITAVGAAGFVNNNSVVSGPAMAAVQLAAPTVNSVGYGTVAGSVLVNVTQPVPAPVGQTYTAVACTNMAMTSGCVTNSSFTSGTNLTPLVYTPGVAGATYYVEVTANASAGYLASPTSNQASHAEMSQLGVPANFAVATSTTTTGAIVATFNPSGTAPSSYTANVCTNPNMVTGCVAPITNYTSGAQIKNLKSGTTYYVQITANPPAGYVSNSTAVSNGVKAK